ncbi:hypothetical protein [Proteiniphilum sp.]|jgi:hypothetical protein|uniref:hypothetical protein n=1 Tax=Proteiniphilum sp. TaxID=1926877 RepID=UPI000928FFFF|nr:hypothetical protein [Proteiniphilum sp.]MEA5128721.1 hypothetical protein [Proteiniphilum sp.]OJV83246.1 MAG: hypothetical protein BGO34_16335 [Bacteroidia bacterium 44-10]
MNTYFAVLKGGVSFAKVSRTLKASGIKIINYYRKLGVVKFETEKSISDIDFDFFISIEEENNNFGI